jgi:predicted transposase YdaD
LGNQGGQDINIELITTTIVYKFPKLSRQEVAEMLGLVELQDTRVYQEGVEKGMEDRLKHERSLILKLLTRKLSTFSPKVQSQIESLPLPELEALGEALLDFSTQADLADWLLSHNS